MRLIFLEKSLFIVTYTCFILVNKLINFIQILNSFLIHRLIIEMLGHKKWERSWRRRGMSISHDIYVVRFFFFLHLKYGIWAGACIALCLRKEKFQVSTTLKLLPNKRYRKMVMIFSFLICTFEFEFWKWNFLLYRTYKIIDN